VEEAERDAAVHPAAYQHRHPQRRPVRRRAPLEVFLIHRNHIACSSGARRRRGRRGGRECAERLRRRADAQEGFRDKQGRAPDQRTEGGGDDAQHGWSARRSLGGRVARVARLDWVFAPQPVTRVPCYSVFQALFRKKKAQSVLYCGPPKFTFS
jgi:hypothetical protein